MKFACDTKAFIAAMGVAGRVIPQKTHIPILQTIKIVTNDSRVTLVGSDGDMTLEMDVVATVQTEGVICLPFEPLSKFVGASKSDSVTIEGGKDQATITNLFG